MASYNPPSEKLPIFDPRVFSNNSGALTYAEASKYFLKYPTAQGTETLQTTNINGLLTVNAGMIITTISGFLGIDMNITPSSGNVLKINGPIDMMTFNIKNILSLIGVTNSNLIIQANGTGHLQLFSNSVNRLTFRDTNECLANSNGLYIQGTTSSTTQVRLGYNSSTVSQGNNSIQIGGGTSLNQGAFSTSVGAMTLGQIQSSGCCSFGYGSGSNQSSGCCSFGNGAGAGTQLQNSICIGPSSGLTSVGINSILLGYQTADSGSTNIIAIGYQASQLSTSNDDSIAIGRVSAKNTGCKEAISIGALSGNNNLGNGGWLINGDGPIALGYSSMNLGSAIRSIGIGSFSMSNSINGTQSIGIGYNSAQNCQRDVICLGANSGKVGCLQESICIGLGAGNSNCSTGWSLAGDGSVCIGSGSGANTMSFRSVAIGGASGAVTMASNSVGIGYGASNSNAGVNTTCIGSLSGQTNAKAGLTCYGANSGNAGGGVNSLFLGFNAGTTSTITNSIILNASGSAFNPATSSAFYVNPIRGTATATPLMVYTPGTGEVTYQTSSIKYKKNVIDLTRDTTALYNLRAREYDTKSDNIHHIGYIAEEVNEVETNFTWKNEDGTPEGLDTFNMLVYAIEEIKKLRFEINQMKGIQNPERNLFDINDRIIIEPLIEENNNNIVIDIPAIEQPIPLLFG